MNISPSGVISPHRGLRVFMLLLAWVVGASFSWADLLDLHAAVGGAPVDLPQATELDLDEIRDDTATNWFVEEGLAEGLSIRRSPVSSLRLCAIDDALLPTRALLSKLSVYRSYRSLIRAMVSSVAASFM